MTGKEITDLSVATAFENGDLISLRKNGQSEDKAISFENVLKSIGNTAVDGFVASSTEANKIILNSVNGVTIDQYYNGMKISFVSPIQSTGVVQVKVGSLTYKNLLAYQSTSSVVIEQNDYIEAVLIGEAFYQVNNAQYIYTNDYKVVLIEPNIVAGYTDVFLETAYGVSKPSYYQGMTVNFLCTEDTSGLTRISVDGLPVKDMLENSGDYIDLIYTPLYKGQIVRLIYDGQSFIKDRFSNNDPKIQIPVLPDPNKPDEPLIPPQNQLSFTVGTQGNNNFTSLPKAFNSLLTQYGQDGGGRKVTLTITSDLDATANAANLEIVKDVSWITLVGGTNNTIKFTGTMTSLYILAFDKCCSFAVGTIIDFSTVTFSNPTSEYPCFFATSSIALDSVTINGNPSIYRLIAIIVKKSGRIHNCTIQNLNYGIVLNNPSTNISIYRSTIKNCSTNSLTFNYAGTGIIESSDLSKSGTSASTDILITSGVTVTQINSRAKSNLVPNTNNNTGTYWVTGSQDAVGT